MAAQYGIASDPEGDIDFISLGRVIWRHKFVVAIVTALCVLTALVVALTATPIYRAEVVVTRVQEDGMGAAGSLMGQFGGLASLVGVNLPTGAAGEEGAAVLESRRLIEEFITRRIPLPQLLPHSKRPPTVWLAAKAFKEDVLNINEDTRKRTTTVSIDWTDPAEAARWANEFVALANELVRTHALEEASRNIAYLNGQLTHTDVVELRRVIYDLIETQTKRLMLANGRLEYAFMVVDPAVPPEIRRSPRRTLIVLAGALLGLMLGMLAAFARNAVLNARVRAKIPMSE